MRKFAIMSVLVLSLVAVPMVAYAGGYGNGMVPGTGSDSAVCTGVCDGTGPGEGNGSGYRHGLDGVAGPGMRHGQTMNGPGNADGICNGDVDGDGVCDGNIDGVCNGNGDVDGDGVCDGNGDGVCNGNGQRNGTGPNQEPAI